MYILSKYGIAGTEILIDVDIKNKDNWTGTSDVFRAAFHARTTFKSCIGYRYGQFDPELSTGRMGPRVGSGRVGSGRVGSGRVGSGRVTILPDFGGLGRVSTSDLLLNWLFLGIRINMNLRIPHSDFHRYLIYNNY